MGPKCDQNTTDKGGKGRDPGWNPSRKKKNIAKTKPTAGKGCMREGNTQTVTEVQHAPAVGRTRPGGEFRAHFGSHFGPMLAQFSDLFASPFWTLILYRCLIAFVLILGPRSLKTPIFFEENTYFYTISILRKLHKNHTFGTHFCVILGSFWPRFIAQFHHHFLNAFSDALFSILG